MAVRENRHLQNLRDGNMAKEKTDDKYYSVNEILSHKLFIASRSFGLPYNPSKEEFNAFQVLLVNCLKILPKKLVDEVFDNCLFMYCPRDASAAVCIDRETIKALKTRLTIIRNLL